MQGRRNQLQAQYEKINSGKQKKLDLNILEIDWIVLHASTMILFQNGPKKQV